MPESKAEEVLADTLMVMKTHNKTTMFLKEKASVFVGSCNFVLINLNVFYVVFDRLTK